jgi:hypothetical protein
MDHHKTKPPYGATLGYCILMAVVMAVLPWSTLAYGQDDAPQEAPIPEIRPRPILRLSYGPLRGLYNNEQRNLVTEVTAKVNAVAYSGQSYGLEHYRFHDETSESSGAWYTRLGGLMLRSDSEHWRASRQIELLGGYTLPFVDPKTMVLGLRLLANERAPDAATADVALTAQLALVAGLNVRQVLFSFWDDVDLFVEGHGHYLMAGGSSSGTDVAGQAGLAWNISGVRLDVALGMLDQSMSSTAKATTKEGDLAIDTHYAATQLMVALWM